MAWHGEALLGGFICLPLYVEDQFHSGSLILLVFAPIVLDWYILGATYFLNITPPPWRLAVNIQIM